MKGGGTVGALARAHVLPAYSALRARSRSLPMSPCNARLAAIQVEIIANDQGNRITPSYVAFDGRLPSLCHTTLASVRAFLWRITPASKDAYTHAFAPDFTPFTHILRRCATTHAAHLHLCISAWIACARTHI